MRHIPNILSSFRILLIPFLIYFVLQGEMFFVALTLILSAFSDFLDGFLARRFGWTSQIGKVLDPFADKLTQITICVLFVLHFGGLFFLFFAILVFKEIVMLILGAYFYKKGVKIEGARLFGKVGTVLFYLVVIVIALVPTLPRYFIYAMLLAVTVSAVVSAVLYWPNIAAYRKSIDRK